MKSVRKNSLPLITASNSDVFGKALQDFHQFGESGKLWLHNNYGKPEEMPVEVFFRSEDEISELEEFALSLSKRSILDIGAGVGAHSLILQGYAQDITALEISSAACEIMKSRGVKKVIHGDIFTAQKQYDTLLLLMNGIGLCGDMNGLNTLLPHLKTLLKKDGQILLDSSDISYLYSNEDLPVENYYGQISYQYEYESLKGNWFKWLYIDFDRLKTISRKHELFCELVFEDDMDQYLARIVKIR
ncbi:class I SAM-dependent methyltransferase [Daejeonella sp.]|uniref:class I SAM-dependent methyltransferase n=1 Tax=Daejeonella sp. TaxID=2805397 RepID=UPI003983CADB